MIQVAVSYGFGEDNRYKLDEVPESIQLAAYKYDRFKEQEDYILTILNKIGTQVPVFHLPLDTTKREPNEILSLMALWNHHYGTTDFIIHPNKNIKRFLMFYLENKLHPGTVPYRLAIETFQWKKKKELKSPLEIIDKCIRYYPHVSMCIDTSHIEDVWFDYKIMGFLLEHTTVIHLSNRSKKYGQHLPFNSEKGDLNLVGFVKDLKNRYKWNGTIILEYMPDYHDKLRKNAEYVSRLLS